MSFFFLIVWLWCDLVWIHVGLFNLEFLELSLNFSDVKINVLGVISTNFFLSLFLPESPVMDIWIHLLVYQRSLKFCFFSFILFSHFSLDWIIVTDLSSSTWILSSAGLNLLLSSYSQIFITFIVLSNSRNSILYSSFYLFNDESNSFNYSNVVSLSYLNIFVTAALKSLPCINNIWISFSWLLPPLSSSHLNIFLHALYFFCWKLDI